MPKSNFQQLVQVLLECKSEKDLENLLKGLLTPQEIEEIPTRLQIVKMLKKGIRQREIANKLGVGIATVTRGSREIKRGYFKNIC